MPTDENGPMETTRIQVSEQEELPLEQLGAFPMLQACLEAWKDASQGGHLPGALALDGLPDDVLAYTMILDYLPDEGDARVRIVGEYVGERAAFDAEGNTVRGFFEEEDAELVLSSLRAIAETGRPSLARRAFVPVAGEVMSYVRLILPLSMDGQHVTSFFKTIDPESLKIAP